MNKKEPISMVEVQLKSFVDSKRPKDEEMRKRLDFGYSWDGKLLYCLRSDRNGMIPPIF